MQRRKDAILCREVSGIASLNYASSELRMAVRDGRLAYERAPLNMWEPDRYPTLPMGEATRLTDDGAGYGPRGRGFLAHADVFVEVRRPWDWLRGCLPLGRPRRESLTRADPARPPLAFATPGSHACA